MKEVQQVVEKFDEIVGGHGGQQDVVGGDHRRPAEDHQRQRVAGQADDADDRIDNEPGDESRQLVELDMWWRLRGPRDVTGGRGRRRRDVIVHLHPSAGAPASRSRETLRLQHNINKHIDEHIAVIVHIAHVGSYFSIDSSLPPCSCMA